ncbi:hypothetical protein LUW10_20725 [Pseudomonas veronii]|uniref:gp53-like domain-containing protein n=1 Tax=Pseudomonas veronii TaxID=76761 RepID=UPI001E523691|nr:hypothetical protein [Pseudomonas veronii]UHH28285.1 hypothetical protein LUW10_20725 [Pseudomonas veronii]
MYQIDNSTAAQAIPASTAAGSKGYFTDGNPATGTPATILPAEFMNMLMMENLNVLTAGGVTPDKSKYNQLSLAISNIISSGIDTKVSGDFITAVGFVSDDPTKPYMRRKTDNTIYRLQPAVGVASESVTGLISVASQPEVTTGVDDTKAVTSKKLAQKLSGYLLGDAATVAGFVSGSKTAPYILHTDATVIRLAIPATTLSGYGISDAYTKSQVDTSLSSKANSATTLSGYGITDAYTKAQSNSTFPYSDNALTIGFVSGDVTKPYIQSRTDNNVYRLQPLLGQATESAQGAVAIATQAATNAGTDDAGAITAKKLKFGFASLFAANGYLKFPDWLGGFIIQWGNAGIGDDTIVDVTLPISFPNSFFAAIATAQINVAVTGANTLSATAYKRSLSVVSIGMNQGTTVVPATSGVDYICIGR